MHTLVGVFGTGRRAVEAVRSLDAAGFPASRVQMVDDDPSRAAEVGGRTYAPHGFVLGGLFGVLVTIGFTIWGGLAAINLFGVFLGSVGVVGGLATIGLVIGRTVGRHAPDAPDFAEAVRQGGAVVSVQCTDAERDLAARVLDGSGAAAIRDEPGPEAR